MRTPFLTAMALLASSLGGCSSGAHHNSAPQPDAAASGGSGVDAAAMGGSSGSVGISGSGGSGSGGSGSGGSGGSGSGSGGSIGTGGLHGNGGASGSGGMTGKDAAVEVSNDAGEAGVPTPPTCLPSGYAGYFEQNPTVTSATLGRLTTDEQAQLCADLAELESTGSLVVPEPAASVACVEPTSCLSISLTSAERSRILVGKHAHAVWLDPPQGALATRRLHRG